MPLLSEHWRKHKAVTLAQPFAWSHPVFCTPGVRVLLPLYQLSDASTNTLMIMCVYYFCGLHVIEQSYITRSGMLKKSRWRKRKAIFVQHFCGYNRKHVEWLTGNITTMWCWYLVTVWCCNWLMLLVLSFLFLQTFRWPYLTAESIAVKHKLLEIIVC